ncbi:YqgE/AlgH family protein [Luteipulveratus sp. YIM 133132]|uniref:UPF0301 protein P4R38_05555 n=1 Tax=Luteipulveratus flavus TaxID=3031728 RepID=A0ABT6C4A9_9MICO|nr:MULTISPECIES: YqgE/AlgH family protein [unclassified Luteipulveratus]MDE9367783.1 YqgE/AlgH family protein [Luteipulveratus sp. YIM 133132]MDF8263705.1 YqgE/AlgH family protein [Luteipulveratus sp. YIM 133296]
MTDLTGRLLVAAPRPGGDEAVEGDVFDRSVVLVLHHDDDGAHGLVLNRPLGADVDAVLPGWQEHVSSPQCLFQGGPVSLDSALGLVSVPGADSSLGIKRLFGAVGLVDLDAPPVVVMPEVAALRIFAGYAGWTGGQLEGEIRTGSWYVVDAEARDAFTEQPDDLWGEVLRRQSGALRLVATYPADPSMN